MGRINVGGRLEGLHFGTPGSPLQVPSVRLVEDVKLSGAADNLRDEY